MSDITVVLPIYNVEKYLPKCFNSLLNQTYSNFEIWAVDDGSPDNSKNLIEEFQKRDSRIKLICKKNGGYGSVLEYSVRNIETKYFLICDPDDWLAPDALQILHDTAEKYDSDITVGDKYYVYVQNEEKKYAPTFDNKLNIIPNVVYRNNVDIQKFALGVVSPHAKLYKTSITRNIQFPHHISYTDTVLYLISIKNAHSAIYINKPLAYYLVNRPGNTTTDVRPTIINDYITMWNSIYNQLIGETKNIDYIWLKLYDLFCVILHASRAIVQNNQFEVKYFEQIIEIDANLKPYKKNIKKRFNDRSLKEKILLFGLMNPKLSSLTIKLFLRKKD